MASEIKTSKLNATPVSGSAPRTGPNNMKTASLAPSPPKVIGIVEIRVAALNKAIYKIESPSEWSDLNKQKEKMEIRIWERKEIIFVFQNGPRNFGKIIFRRM